MPRDSCSCSRSRHDRSTQNPQSTQSPWVLKKKKFSAGSAVSAFYRRRRAHIVLTVRADSVRHGGQVSLPGGVVEPGETFEQAALREAHEEVALPLDGVRVLGALTPLDIPVSGFRLHPIVAVTEHAADADAGGRRGRAHPRGRRRRSARSGDARRTRRASATASAIRCPAFHVGGREIWGATAMVLAEFLALLGWTGRETA